MIQLPLNKCSHQTRLSMGVLAYNTTFTQEFVEWCKHSLEGPVSVGTITGIPRCLIFETEGDKITFLLGWCNQHV